MGNTIGPNVAAEAIDIKKDGIVVSVNNSTSWIYSNGSKKNELYTNKPGLMNGFQIELLVGEPKNLKSFGFESGAHVFIGNKTTYTSFYEGKF